MMVTADIIIVSIYLLSILSAASLAFINRSSLKGRSIFILLPFLTYVFLQEIIIILYRTNISAPADIEKAGWHITATYNVYKIICALTVGWMYSTISLLHQYKRLIMGLVIIYTTMMITSFFFTPISIAVPSLLLLRNSIITFFGTLFLYRFFLLDNLAKQQFWKPELLITIGIVFFYPVSAIALTFHKYLYKYDATLYGLKLYQTIPQLMSIFMYSCFCYAFYLCKKKN